MIWYQVMIREAGFGTGERTTIDGYDLPPGLCRFNQLFYIPPNSGDAGHFRNPSAIQL
jgi:hypothetical protein